MRKAYPICTEPCGRVWSHFSVGLVLHEQDMAIRGIRKHIMDARIKSLTPEIMKQELMSLEHRISSAKSRNEPKPAFIDA